MGLSMYRILSAAAASVAIAIPTIAQAGSLYFGIEAGLLFGRPNDIDEVVAFTTSQSPSSPLAPPGIGGLEFDDTYIVSYKKGYDVDLIGGYDFGVFRLELELGQRSVGIRELKADETADSLLEVLNSELNRPSSAPGVGAPSLPALADRDFDLSGKVRAQSVMVDGLFDLPVSKRATLYGGGGLGRSWVSTLGDTDTALAWQYVLGARYRVSDHVELGIKHRYFNSGIVRVRHPGVAYDGNPNRLTVTPPGGQAIDIDQTTNALVRPELEGEFRTRSIMAGLIYNF